MQVPSKKYRQIQTVFNDLVCNTIWLTTVTFAIILLTNQKAVAQPYESFIAELDWSTAPTRESVEYWLDENSLLKDMSPARKEGVLQYLTDMASQHYSQGLDKIRKSCTSEIDSFCANLTDNPASCLLDRQNDISFCCESAARALSNTPGLTSIKEFSGMTLPIGTTVQYDSQCEHIQLSLKEAVKREALVFGPGILELSAENMPVYSSQTRIQDFNHPVALNYQGLIESGPIKAGTSYRGIALATDTNQIFFNNGSPYQLTTTENTFFDGKQLQAGNIVFYKNHKIKKGNTATPHKTPMGLLPEGTQIAFDKLGYLESFTANENFTLSGINYLKGRLYSTYPNGQVRTIVTSHHPVLVSGVLYPEHTSIEFYADGFVLRDSFRDKTMHSIYNFSDPDLTLVETDKPVSMDLLNFVSGSLMYKDARNTVKAMVAPTPLLYKGIALRTAKVYFKPNELVDQIVLGAPIELPGSTVPTGSTLKYDRNAQLGKIILSDATSYGTAMLSAHQEVRVYPDGNIKKGFFDSGSRFAGIDFDEEVEITLSQSGYVVGINAEEPVSYNGIAYDGRHIRFKTSGAIQGGILNINTQIDGVLYAAGTELLIDDSGKVTNSLAGVPRWKDGIPPTRENSSESSKTTSAVIIVGSERPISNHMPLRDQLPSEKCEELFPGYRDGKNVRVSGFSLGSMSISPARFGCGRSDEEAGILERLP